MSVQAQAENYGSALPELRHFFEEDGQPDDRWDRFADAHNRGALHVVTLRDAGRMTACWIGLMARLPHRPNDLIAVTDQFKALPAVGQGLAGGGTKLFRAVAAHAQAHGATQLLHMVPLGGTSALSSPDAAEGVA